MSYRRKENIFKKRQYYYLLFWHKLNLLRSVNFFVATLVYLTFYIDVNMDNKNNLKWTLADFANSKMSNCRKNTDTRILKCSTNLKLKFPKSSSTDDEPLLLSY